MISKSQLYKLYDTVVQQARQPALYRLSGIRDDFDTRFDFLVLHLVLILRHMARLSSTPKLLSRLMQIFFDDMDQTLRELGVGDLGMTHRMRRMTEAFYGRQQAYNRALDMSDKPLLQATLARNFLPNSTHEAAHLHPLTAYVEALEGSYGEMDLAQLLGPKLPHRTAIDSIK